MWTLPSGGGEYRGLLGPNGAGKSTTLKLLTGLIKPSEGEVYINGKNMSDDIQSALSDVGCLIETPLFYNKTSPMDILKYTGKLKGLNHAEIEIRSKSILEELRMYEWRNGNVNSFSKGMRQRVGIAQAMLGNPSLLILDEPTTGLDPRGMIEFRQILSDLKRFGVSLLLSTHNLSEVSSICESVTILRNGRSVASGTVSDLVKNVGSRTTTLIIKTVKPVNREFLNDLEGLPGVSKYNKRGDTEIIIEFSGDAEQQSAIVSMVIQHDLGLVSMVEEMNSNLEKLYMDLSVDEEVSK